MYIKWNCIAFISKDVLFQKSNSQGYPLNFCIRYTLKLIILIEVLNENENDLSSRRERWKLLELNTFQKKKRYLFCYFSDKALKSTLVTLTFHYVNGGKIYIKSTIGTILSGRASGVRGICAPKHRKNFGK